MSKDIKNKIVPKLRFSEFRNSQDWKETLIGEIANVTTGGTPESTNSKYWNGEIPWMNSGELNQKRVYSVANRITSLGLKESSTRLIPPYCILIGLAGQGKTRGTAAINYIQLCTNQSIASIHPNKEIFNSEFLYQYIDSIYDELRALSTGEGGRGGLNLQIIKSLKLFLPLLEEQQKIADCLFSLDELITAQNQKLQAIKAHKKGLMQQLFPAEDETVPKLRFAEFKNSGEWVEKTLGEIAELTSSKRVHLSDYVTNGIPFFRGKEISMLKKQKLPEDLLYIAEQQYEEIKDKYGVPQMEDILITAVGTLGNVYRIQNNSRFYFKDGNLIWLKNITEESKFVETLLEVNHDKVLSSAIGSSQKALTMVELNKLVFKFPMRKEQQKIADCLSSLDELINARTEKIEALKVHKKGLMQGLFPAINDSIKTS